MTLMMAALQAVGLAAKTLPAPSFAYTGLTLA